MFINTLRNNAIASYVLLIARLYLGYTWVTSGWGKISAGGFDATGLLKGAVAGANAEKPTVQAWWGSFIDGFALPNVELFNVLVPWGEFLVGLGLILGCLTKTAIFFGMVMNFAFLFSGVVSTNAIMVLISMFIIVSGSGAGKIGIDGFLLTPFLKSKGIFKKFSKFNRYDEEKHAA